MKKKEIAAIVIAVGIFLFVGCNFNRFMPAYAPSVQNMSATPTDADPATPTEAVPATPTEAETAPPTTEEPTTLKQYDFSKLTYSANSTAAACFNVKENRYLFEKNTQDRIPPASLTKIVTTCVALKYADPSAVFTVGDELMMVEKDSSLCFIKAGHQVTLHDLLCGMLLASGNDAAYTVAVNIARTVSGNSLSAADAVAYFVNLMNEFATEIGLTNSHFVNPDGWDNDEHYMCLRDIITAAGYALRQDVFREIVGQTSYFATFVTGQTIEWKNSNQMMNNTSQFFVENVKGIKTGTTPKAGRCLIVLFDDGTHELIAASMGNPTDEERYYSVREMIDTVRLQ